MTEAKKEVYLTFGADVSSRAISVAKIALEIGQKMADGSVFAGMTADGKSEIYAMPEDLDLTMNFNEAARAVQKLNNQKALRHDDWQIPTLENLYVLYKNQNEGALKGTFKTVARSGSDYPDWYWSSTVFRLDSSFMNNVCFSDGYEGCYLKNGKLLSCRPVRLVAASRSPAPV
jgi:hypothetical protein